MGFWDKSLRIFNCLCENGKQSVRRIAQKTGLSKSSVHRLQQAMARRGDAPEAWLWEIEEGRLWLTRFVVATLYTFSLTRGVGLDTISAFFAHRRLESQLGCSPTALRGVMQTVAATIMETAAAWEDDGIAAGEVRDIIGAVDETFLERMMLVVQDVSTGYLLLEEVAEDRPYATWKAVVDTRLEDLRTGVVSLVSDRAQAFMQRAEKGLGCLSIPDFFPFVHESVKRYALALGRRLRQAHQELKHAEEVLERRAALAYPAPPSLEAKAHVEATHAEVTQWAELQRPSRHHLETLSLTLQPCRMADAVPQSSAQVERQLHVEVEALAA
jgi:hypothetical protein